MIDFVIRKGRLAVSVIVTMVVLSTHLGCGPDARQKALKANLIALNSARDGFVAWDDTRQNQIVDAAKTYEEGVKALDEYRAAREPVVKAFEAAYRLLATAAYDPTLANALAAYHEVMAVWTILKDFTGTSPGVDPPKPE